MSQINGKILILKIVKQNFAVEAATEICSFYRILEIKNLINHRKEAKKKNINKLKIKLVLCTV